MLINKLIVFCELWEVETVIVCHGLQITDEEFIELNLSNEMLI